MYIRENKYLQNLGNPFGEFLLLFQAFSKHNSVNMVYDVEPLELWMETYMEIISVSQRL